MEIKPEHRAILEATKPHFETAKQGWVQEVQNLQMLEHIYHTYLDHRFVLTVWCKDCVIKMLQRLGAWYEKQPQFKRCPNFQHVQLCTCPNGECAAVKAVSTIVEGKMELLEQKQNTNENTSPRKRK